MKQLTAQEVNRKYKGKYIEIHRVWGFETNSARHLYSELYEVRKIYATIHENTTLGEDVGTAMEYRR